MIEYQKNNKFVRQYHCVKSVRIWCYSVQMRENTNQNNSEYGHFLRSVHKINHLNLGQKIW